MVRKIVMRLIPRLLNLLLILKQRKFYPVDAKVLYRN